MSPEATNSDSYLPDVKYKKSLKSVECLQESGIFEDSDPISPTDGSGGGGGGIGGGGGGSDAIILTKQTKGCQTESVLDKTLLEFIDSSCELLNSNKNNNNSNKHCQQQEQQKCSDDLSTEISKLSVIRKRIQQKTKSPNSPKEISIPFTCPHTNSVPYYEERLAQLEDKLKIYESTGDAKDILLSKRLQKEVDLAYRVKELTEKVATLEIRNKKLEEEKCEFEEAENDVRYQLQR